ncbi:hypothetical protein IAT40_005567 [Kwoniella sp. CBS 6097]
MPNLARNRNGGPSSPSLKAQSSSELSASTSGPNTNPTGPISPGSVLSLHLHPSIQSHLATELSFLHTLILRARDQHRLQLFLRRMYDVLRVGKAVLGFVRACANAFTSASAKSNNKSVGMGSEVDRGAGAGTGLSRWRKKGSILVSRMIKSLYTAQRFTAQIIELHHFLPLQTSVLAIYARLFVLTLNVANALGMDIENLISSGGGRLGAGEDHGKKGRAKGKKREGQEGDGSLSMLEGGGVSSSSSFSMESATQGARNVVNVDMEVVLGLGSEVGERIERTPFPQTTQPQLPIKTTKKKGITSMQPSKRDRISVPSPIVGRETEAAEIEDGIDIDVDDLSCPLTLPAKSGSAEASHTMTIDESAQDESKATSKSKPMTEIEAGLTTKTKKRRSPEIESDDLQDRVKVKVKAKDNVKIKTKTKDKVADEINNTMAESEKLANKKNKKKKPRKDDMDDIFGF